MTEKELNQIYWINIEIKKLTEEKERLENRSLVKGQEITGLPGGGQASDKVADFATELAEIKELLNLAIKKLYITRSKVERFLDTIEDSEIRLIIRLRSVNNLSWYQIGEELGMDRRTARNKYKKFLEMY